tara:strand:+ start:437 stop:937 length:501 start_codon:yes stop_codon:yes gene_type:complete
MIRTAKESLKRKLIGEKLQNLVLALILKYFPELHGEITSCHMCSHGEDIKFSDMARAILKICIECKTSKKGYSKAYQDLEQAQRQTRMLGRAEDDISPVAFVNEEAKPILAVLYGDDYLKLQRENYSLRQENRRLKNEEPINQQPNKDEAYEEPSLQEKLKVICSA